MWQLWNAIWGLSILPLILVAFWLYRQRDSVLAFLGSRKWLPKRLLGLTKSSGSLDFPTPVNPYILPDQTNATWGMDFLIQQLYDNVWNLEFPEVGDIVNILHTDGMGMGIRRHDRYRVMAQVKNEGKFRNLVTLQSVDNGHPCVENIGFLRKYTKNHHTWIRIS